MSQPGHPRDLLLSDRTAVERPEEVVEQALSGGSVIEHVTDQSGLGGLFHEVAEAFARRSQPLQEEGEHCGEASG